MDKQYYKEYYHLEREHWWFKARLEILEALSKDLKIDANKSNILNAGAATGATSLMLEKFGDVLSLEYDKTCADFLSTIVNKEVLNASLTSLPIDEKQFDLVCAFDVIEHIDDHKKAVKEIHRVLKNEGTIFLTVPAFKSLWSKHDEINHHYRRYRLKELQDLLRQNGFEIEYSSYFNFCLFPPIYLLRILSKLFPSKNRNGNGSTGSDFEKFDLNFLNKILYRIFRSESYLLKRKVRLPFGVSALIIGKKKPDLKTN